MSEQSPSKYEKSSILSFIREWGIAIFSAFMIAIVFKSFAYASYHIPSESMMPTLEVGDRLFVNKAAYGYSKYSLPFSSYLPSLPGKHGRMFYSEPKRGDVVVFSNPKDGVVTIKRLVGLPGDTIKVIDGRLIVNGAPVKRHLTDSYSYREYMGQIVRVREFSELLPGGHKHKIIEQTDQGYLDNTYTYQVPDGHVFFMGDNRDNSTDSRVIESLGYVPIENIIGRADLIAYSFYHCKKSEDLRCASRRFLEVIR